MKLGLRDHYLAATGQKVSDAITGRVNDLVDRDWEIQRSGDSESSEKTEKKEIPCRKPAAGGFCDSVFAHPSWPATIPKEAGSKVDHQFLLARTVRQIELDQGRPATPAEQRIIFSRWFESAREFISPSTTLEDSFADYLGKFGNTRHPIEYSSLNIAWEKAKAATPVLEVQQAFGDGSKIEFLARLMRELARLSPDGVFFVSTRNVGELLGTSHETAAKWIRTIKGLRLITVSSPGDQTRSPRYRWVPSLDSTTPTPETRALSTRPGTVGTSRSAESKETVRSTADQGCSLTRWPDCTGRSPRRREDRF